MACRWYLPTKFEYPSLNFTTLSYVWIYTSWYVCYEIKLLWYSSISTNGISQGWCTLFDVFCFVLVLISFSIHQCYLPITCRVMPLTHIPCWVPEGDGKIVQHPTSTRPKTRTVCIFVYVYLIILMDFNMFFKQQTVCHLVQPSIW